MEKYVLSDDTEIEVESTGEKTTMHWRGSLDYNNTDDLLGTYLRDFHNKCKKQRIRKLDINFTEVDFMNTAGIKCVIRWLRDISNDNQYKTSIHINTEISWQDITFETFAQLLQNIEFSRK